MNQPNLTPIAADGRRWLLQQPANARWDLIAVDAYRPPYIPFHLTTLEFFQLVRTHLSEDGILAINIGRTASNFALVDALSKTVAQVFPAVYLIDEPGPAGNLSNSLLVATAQPTQLENLAGNVALLSAGFPTEFQQFAQAAIGQARQATPPADAAIFTDDRAPVEQIVHRIILDFMLGQ
jgi:predicted membrane-bound spermidine synthase